MVHTGNLEIRNNIDSPSLPSRTCNPLLHAENLTVDCTRTETWPVALIYSIFDCEAARYL